MAFNLWGPHPTKPVNSIPTPHSPLTTPPSHFSHTFIAAFQIGFPIHLFCAYKSIPIKSIQSISVSPPPVIVFSSMPPPLSILFVSLLVFIHPTSALRRIKHPIVKDDPSSSDQIQLACKATRYQPLCESSLRGHPSGNVMEIIQSAFSVSSQNLHAAQSMAQNILEASAGDLNHTTAANNCIENLRNSDYRLKSTADALTRGKTKDGRAWTSAGLAYQYDCWSALKYVNDTKMIDETMSFLNTLIEYTSNALSMMMAYDVNGDQTASWTPPKTERDGFWEGGGGGSGGGGQQLGVPAGLKADVTVCKVGGCDHETVQEAVNGAPDWGHGRRFVIWVKTGVYQETVRVGLEKQNVVILGDGMGKTVITGSMNVGQPGLSTYNTATVGKSPFVHL